ncbi:phytase [Pedobacter frigoris]|uniref:Phytase n=1 Tax=Pedobacter frigoris TaxID=2571272 RepID=A0A4U1CTZ4_9SPHI|nr:phytase [Pedobacter frigoris]TKC09459.1 phytase [Pedobacter frigoris]
MNIKTYQLLTAAGLIFAACNGDKQTIVAADAIKPVVTTDTVLYDTDDPAIWINPTDSSKSLIIGTDKETDGGLYVYNLDGKMVNKVSNLKRPNNVDIAYGLKINGKKLDIAVTTERETNKIRIYSIPDMAPIDNGGIAVFDGETEKDPMGVALYTAADSSIYVIVGRKSGPVNQYLWQYKLSDNRSGGVKAEVVRKFGKYSGKKEIEAIAVDNELGFIYYSDETVGVHKYYADPAKGNNELALFAKERFASDHEGISIYKTGINTGYILVSNQQKNTFMVYPREGTATNPNEYKLLAEVPVSTIESDGSEVTNVNLGPRYPKGLFVAMSNGKVFHYYDWRDIKQKIDAAKK